MAIKRSQVRSLTWAPLKNLTKFN